jgi:RNA polymerase sigma-70 factor (ECF subfamily)
VSDSAAHRAIEAVWRIESARLIGGLVRIVGDLGLAEDLAQDALVDALARWPESGVPENPGAWLMAAAKFRAIDLLRRGKRLERKQEELARALAVEPALDGSEFDAVASESIEDDVLRLMFACCHPVLGAEARLALTLRLLGGLTTSEISRAFLVSEATVAQRIVRAKRVLTKARADFSIPERDELEPRLGSVLEVIYLVFNEGYTATAGDAWIRPKLCEEALRLGRILAELVPGEAEVYGLVALMELQASRLAARTGASGEPILLSDQDRSRWDRLLIGRGLAALEHAARLGTAGGPYALQAQIAACHARAPSAAETDWRRITALYEALLAATPSPVIALNHAVAAATAFGAEVGLALLEPLRGEPALAGYHLLPSVRGELLVRIGRTQEARREFERAAGLTENVRERSLLAARAAACA